MHHEGCPDVCVLPATFALLWIGEVETSFAFPWGGPDGRTIVMCILRGIRMMMVRLITRATCHCEVRATCFPEGGVPTMRKLNWIGLDLKVYEQFYQHWKSYIFILESTIFIILNISSTLFKRLEYLHSQPLNTLNSDKHLKCLFP